MSKRQIVILSTLGLLACVILLVMGVAILSLLSPSPRQAKVPTATRQAVKGSLPGLQAYDITGNLEDRGFDCTRAERQETIDVFLWACQQETSSYLFYVDIYGETLMTVDYVSATAIDYSGLKSNLPVEFLGFVATAPYDYAQPDKARGWVNKNVRSKESYQATLGRVDYDLSGPSAARTLTMGTFRW